MNLNQIKGIYFVGIGGIGMSAIARYFNTLGIPVWGYDKTSTRLTAQLELEGIEISFKDEMNSIPAEFLKIRKEEALVVYTPAIPKDSLILNYFKDQKYTIQKRSEVLGLLSKAKFCIAVAGTHGKTTTSSMIAHIMRNAGINCSAFLGGIASNYNSNFLLGDSEYLVVEADEFDRSFLTLFPNISVITSMDPDHLDIYGDKNVFADSFRTFAAQVKEGGVLIRKNSLELVGGQKYSLEKTQDSSFYAANIQVINGAYSFNFVSSNLLIEDIKLGLPGIHNLENAVAAAAVALSLGISSEKIKEGIENFKGVKRRFEYIIKSDSLIYIDDYAHHPEELRACFKSIKQLYPGKKVAAIFQPHLFSRTRDFMDGFAEVLGMPDELVLLPIYPARELPIEGINSELLLSKVQNSNKQLCAKENVLDCIENLNFDVLVTVGAGDIDTCVEKIKNHYDKKA